MKGMKKRAAVIVAVTAAVLLLMFFGKRDLTPGGGRVVDVAMNFMMEKGGKMQADYYNITGQEPEKPVVENVMFFRYNDFYGKEVSYMLISLKGDFARNDTLHKSVQIAHRLTFSGEGEKAYDSTMLTSRFYADFENTPDSEKTEDMLGVHMTNIYRTYLVHGGKYMYAESEALQKVKKSEIKTINRYLTSE